MDYKQLLTDIFTLNGSAFKTRLYKLKAVLQRNFLLPEDNFATTKNYKEIPIILNNRNRLTHLKQMLDWLTASGYSNIIILDNDSNYEPLLEFYKTTSVKVIHLKNNFGHLAFWKSGVYKQFYKDYYAYSDPDLVGVENCPEDFVKHFISILSKYSNIEKVGFALKIDDLPDYYEKKVEVMRWEDKFWKKEIETQLFDAPIDTTFAVYKPYTNGAIWVQNALRTGGTYVLRHLPWYEDSKNKSEEDVFYMNNMKKGASHWINNNK